MDKESFEQTMARLDQELRDRRDLADKRRRFEEELAQVHAQMEAVRERLRTAEELGAVDVAQQLTSLLSTLTDDEVRLSALLKAPVRAKPGQSRAEGPAAAPPPSIEKPAPSRAEGPVPSRPEGPVPSRPEGPSKKQKAPLPAPVEKKPEPVEAAAPKEPPPPPAPPKPPEDDEATVREVKAAVESLVEEVEERIPAMTEEPSELRNARFEIWSRRWRILEERAENGVFSAKAILRWAFARLMEARKSIPDVPFLRAFNPKEQGDWPKELEEAEGLLAKLRLKHRPPRTRAVEVYARRRVEETKAEQRTQEALLALDALKAVPVSFSLPEDEEGVKTFLEAARACVKFAKKIGPELREVCGPYRDLLEGEEFEAIWHVEEKVPATPQESERAAEEASVRRRTWTRRDILARMLRRMYVKKEIGGKHTEIHNLYQGLPDHVRGEAKEGVDFLVKEGVLRWKPTTKDEHVSIEPPAVRIVEDLIDGKALPANIQRWMDEAAARR